jgi:hypothetical protein
MPSTWHGRVVLVRTLSVRLREYAPAHHISLAIEREWQRLARSAVEWVHASPTAEAVWFAGQIEARLALIARLSADADVTKWFWRRMLPLGPAASREEQLIALFAAPWADPRVSAHVQMRFARMAFAELRSKTRAVRIVQALDDVELRRLLPSLTDGDVLQRWSLIARVHDEGDAGVPVAHTDDALDRPASSADESPRTWAIRFAFAAIDGRLSEVHDSAERMQRAEPSITTQAVARAITRDAGEGITSHWAGLFFVLNLLAHVDDPPSSSSETLSILRAVATQLRIRPDEAIYEALANLNDDQALPAVSPAQIRVLRLACLRTTRRPLRRIVSRAGRIVITRTHLTVVFDMSGVRLDVRKAGLDLDPGWLPRLGRVVRFEYE